MTVTYQDYINTVKSSSAQRILKIEILDTNYNIIDTITPDIISGDLQLTNEFGSRRNCNIVFNNYNGDYIPDPDGDFWINSKYKVYTGYKVNGEDYYFSRGIFLSGEPQVNSIFAEQTTDLQLYDQWCNLDGTLAGTLDTTYKIPSGTDLEAAVRQIFSDAGETRPVIYEPFFTTPVASTPIAATPIALPYTIIMDANGTYADILKKLADMVSYTCYYDSQGYPRFEPPTDIDSAGSIWDYNNTDSISLYLGSRRRFEYSKVKNYIVVIGSNVNGLTYKATASDNNSESSTRISLIGKRALVITDDVIYSTSLAQQRANYELQKAMQVIETVNAESIPIDIIEGDNIITYTDSGNGFNNSRFLVKSVSFPLMNDGNMTLNLWNARSFLG
jgi:hypothetical protein